VGAVGMNYHPKGRYGAGIALYKTAHRTLTCRVRLVLRRPVMTWRDKLELGVKEDAPYRKDNLSPSRIRGPELLVDHR
jgi:hypothetical protein